MGAELKPEAALAAIRAMNETLERVGQRAAASGASEIRTVKVPAVSVGMRSDGTLDQATEPAPEPIEEPAAPADASAPAPPPPPTTKVDEVTPQRLTDAQIFDKVAPFVDPTMPAPIFITEPILRRVYVARYPNLGEMLSSERILADVPEGADKELRDTFGIIGELQVAVKGWLPEGDPRIDAIRANPADVSRWPELYTFSLLNQRDPRVMDVLLVELWKQYLTWKISVTPTDDEMDFYYGRAGLARSS